MGKLITPISKLIVDKNNEKNNETHGEIAKYKTYKKSIPESQMVTNDQEDNQRKPSVQVQNKVFVNAEPISFKTS